jgi:hypothetical protein
MSHPLLTKRISPTAKKESAVSFDASSTPWPSFTGTAQLIGTSPSGRTTVFVDPSLGDPGLENANDLLADADRVMEANDAIFGKPSSHVNVIIFAMGDATDGTGGADHASCNFTDGGNIEVCAAFDSPAKVSALFEAELSECCMNGNLCGLSTGEALSRWCAASVSNNALADFATAPDWFTADPSNFVDQTDPTDQSADSTGCGMAFISWLLSQGIALATIAQDMVKLGDSGTFADLYNELTGNPASSAWPNFLEAVRALPCGVTDDDPFKG